MIDYRDQGLVPKRMMILATTLLLGTNSGCGAAGGTLTVAATGVVTSQVLDKLEDKAKTIMGQAAAAASLVTTKAARDALLLTQAARQEMHDELAIQWDHLNGSQVEILRNLDSSLTQLSDSIGLAGGIKDEVVLDIEGRINQLPFTKNVPRIQRVEGASQYFRDEGMYNVVLTGNIFSAFAGKVYVGDREIVKAGTSAGQGSEVDVYILRPPYSLVVRLTTTFLNEKYFDDSKLTYVPIRILTSVPNREYFFQWWKEKERPAQFEAVVETFPRFPVRYQASEHVAVQVTDPEKTEIQKGSLMTVGGCGNSGCNAYYTVCTDAPNKGEPVAIVQYYDSFSGWGGFGDARRSVTGWCATYWQHSHNVARNVGFDISYHPLKAVTERRALHVEALGEESAVSTSPGGQSEIAGLVTATISVACPLVPKVTMKTVGVGPFGIELKVPLTELVPECPAPPPLPPAPPRAEIETGRLRFGRTYSVRFDSESKGFDFIAWSFTGEQLVATEGKTNGLIAASPITDQAGFKRMTIELKKPW